MNIRLFLFLALMFFSKIIFSQGCSDAGVCTMNSFKPQTEPGNDLGRGRLKLGTSFGGADQQIAVLGPYIEYNRAINQNLSFDVRLTSLSQRGNNVSAFGLSDLYLNVNYALAPAVSFTLGLKYPLADGNLHKDGLPLPMDYQSSLGTTDLLVGFKHDIHKFQIVAAYQQPLTQNNNEFLASDYPTDSKLSDFQSTFNYKRSGDVLLRVSYPISLSQNLRLTPGLLPIYHIGNDKYTEAGIEKEITGSKGLTLNANIFLDYSLGTKSNLQLSLGSPLVVRDARPDGLTRSFVASLEYQIRF